MSAAVDSIKKRIPVLYILIANFLISNFLYMLFVNKLSYDTSSKLVSTATIVLCAIALFWDRISHKSKNEEIGALSRIYSLAFIICTPVNLIISGIEHCVTRKEP